MKPTTKARQALLASLLGGAALVSTGCSSSGFSLASMNPFANPAPTINSNPSAAGRLTESIASTTSSMGTTAKSALGKTTSAVASVFTRSDDGDDQISASDPLSLSNKPQNIGPEVFVANGQLWESTGDLGKAMESYTKAIESDANNAPALTSIARLHFRQGKHKLAADFFRRAIEQNPEDAGLYNDLGLTLSKLSDHAGSTKSLEKALQLAPGTSRYANNLASVKFEAGDPSSAFQVLKQNNKPAVAHFNMAYLHFKNGQMTEARSHLSEALRSDPQAADDPAVQRAVERSRDMLAQIEGSMSPVAQAAPQAAIAGGQFFGGTPQRAVVQQTSQSSATQTSVAPAAPTAPATLAITAPPSEPQATAVKSERALPIRPAEPTADAQPPSFPFALPTGFATPQTK